MYHIRDFWRKVREIEAGLPEEVFLMSIEDPFRSLVGGVVVEVKRETAAKAIANKTHRVATDREIAAHRAAAEKQNDLDQSEELRRVGLAVFVLPPAKPETPRKTAS